MTRDTISEILDLESSLQTGCEEAAEGSNQRGECCKHQDVELNWCDCYGIRNGEQFAKGVDE